VNPTVGAKAAVCSYLASVVFKLCSAGIWDSATDLWFPRGHFFCVEIGKYKFYNYNLISVLLLKPKIMIFLHGVSRKFIFIHKASTDMKNLRSILFRLLIRCIMLRRCVSYVNCVALYEVT
jgi:hypothetical protein